MRDGAVGNGVPQKSSFHVVYILISVVYSVRGTKDKLLLLREHSNNILSAKDHAHVSSDNKMQTPAITHLLDGRGTAALGSSCCIVAEVTKVPPRAVVT